MVRSGVRDTKIIPARSADGSSVRLREAGVYVAEFAPACYSNERAAIVVGPTVIRTGELLAAAFAFLGQQGAAMRADPDECPHATILPSHDKNGDANNLDRLVVAGFPHLARERQHQWQPLEDSVHLALPSNRIDVIFDRDVLDVFG